MGRIQKEKQEATHTLKVKRKSENYKIHHVCQEYCYWN